ncbi:MAG TPA: CRTAC1 family protein, partial [Polyangiales bacterium]|nr:CRTAC1 family protein [Polyangiales bacterium]
YTREAIANVSFDESEERLPRHALTEQQLSQLVAFLRALSDDCAADATCRNAWTPDASLDPDGHMQVRNQSVMTAPVIDSVRSVDYAQSFGLNWQSLPTPPSTFADTQACSDGVATAVNANAPKFTSHTGDAGFGLTAKHGFDATSWVQSGGYEQFVPVMIAGGITATYLDDDCWPDLVFAGGDASGLVFYENRGQQQGYASAPNLIDAQLRAALGTQYTGVAVADLDGDYQRELVFGNVLANQVPILARGATGAYYEVTSLPMIRNTYGIGFGILNPGEYPSLFLGHWSTLGTAASSPALFENQGGLGLVPSDGQAGTAQGFINQDHNFSPSFIDLDGDGWQDMTIASDFKTSEVLRNTTTSRFQDVTDRKVVTDENGMGSALGDVDNDGDQDWFVTSILDPLGGAPYLGTAGTTGNRLYRNDSTSQGIVFSDVTDQAGVRNGYWGWGACMQDFDHDGFLDIFHVDGFGYVPAGLNSDPKLAAVKAEYDVTTARFQGRPPRLFMNKGDGTFVESAASWKINAPQEGRGITCFDYDRDGDMDIAFVDHSTGIQFYENQIGHDANHRFLNVRVVGSAPNTEALGARIQVTANVGGGHGVQHQLRVANANSNYNGQNLPENHFGLGSAAKVDTLTITWLNDPTPLVCTNVAVNQFLVFDQRTKLCPP